MEQQLLQVTEIDLVYKAKVKACDRPLIKGTADAYRLLISNWNADKLELQEEFKILLLNRAHRVLGLYEVSMGGVSATTVDPKLIFAAAIKAKASSIIMAHNHPSGDFHLSPADNRITKQLVSAGELLEIQVLDHLIITRAGYYSFADHGLI